MCKYIIYPDICSYSVTGTFTLYYVKKIFQLIKNKKKYISGAKVSFTSATRKTKTAIWISCQCLKRIIAYGLATMSAIRRDVRYFYSEQKTRPVGWIETRWDLQLRKARWYETRRCSLPVFFPALVNVKRKKKGRRRKKINRRWFASRDHNKNSFQPFQRHGQKI